MSMKKENIWNLPNFFTLLRILICFLVIYFILNDYSINSIIIAFVIGMLTDLFDGQSARWLNLRTEFGSKFDIVADRIFMISIAIVLIIHFGLNGILNRWYIFQIILIILREIICLPFVVWFAISKKSIIPKVKFIGKLTTFMQAIAFPLVLLNLYYPEIQFSIYFAIITSIIGIISALTFIRDTSTNKT